MGEFARSAAILSMLASLAFGCSSSSDKTTVDAEPDSVQQKDGEPDSAAKDDSAADGETPAKDSETDGEPDSKTDSKTDSAEPSCPQTPCEFGLTCCGGVCKNLNNDPTNCGKCGTTCPSDKPFCSGSGCGQPPCSNPGSCETDQMCCGATCCEAGKICCSVNIGPSVLECHDGPACPQGCPGCVCAAPDTLIATPSGERPIAELIVGDKVLSWHRGALRAVPLRRVVRQPVTDHHVVRVELDNGTVLNISGPHPTADGRFFSELRAGDWLAGRMVRAVSIVPYPFRFTHDILPASDSGSYVAGGVLIGSTLRD